MCGLDLSCSITQFSHKTRRGAIPRLERQQDVQIADLESVHGHDSSGAQMKARALSFSSQPSQGRRGPFPSNLQGQLERQVTLRASAEWTVMAALVSRLSSSHASVRSVFHTRLRSVSCNSRKKLVQLACPKLSATWFGPTSLQKWAQHNGLRSASCGMWSTSPLFILHAQPDACL